MALRCVKLTRPRQGCHGTVKFGTQGLPELGRSALHDRRQTKGAQITGLTWSRLRGSKTLGRCPVLPALGVGGVDPAEKGLPARQAGCPVRAPARDWLP